MAKNTWRTDVQLTGDVRAAHPTATERDDDQPFVIVVLGDFTGATPGQPSESSRGRRLIEVDRDNFDAVMDRLAPRWQGSLRGLPDADSAQAAVELTFRTIDDFHPDRVVTQLVPLRVLLEARRGLDDPRRFERVAAQVLKWASVPTPASPAPVAASLPPGADVDPAALLEHILDEGSGTAPASREPALGDLQRFLEQVVGPHVVHVDAARQAALLTAVDAALAQQVRAVLHNPAFQALEAVWRSLWWLVDRSDTSTDLKIRILSLSRSDLQTASSAAADPEESPLGRLLLEPRRDPPTLLVGNYEFTQDREDIDLLRWLGRLGAALSAPCVVAASPQLLGCTSFVDMPSPTALEQRLRDDAYAEWHELRQSDVARWLALAMPRRLCRLPYGPKTEPAESFAFEERGPGAAHDGLLWGNPAFAVALVVAQAFRSAGWNLDVATEVQQLDGLPLYVSDQDGAFETTPCAEVLLSDRVVAGLAAAGFLPLVSYRDEDVVALPCMQSAAAPRSPLAWGPA